MLRDNFLEAIHTRHIFQGGNLLRANFQGTVLRVSFLKHHKTLQFHFSRVFFSRSLLSSPFSSNFFAIYPISVAINDKRNTKPNYLHSVRLHQSPSVFASIKYILKIVFRQNSNSLYHNNKLHQNAALLYNIHT